jgi:hypothetical protein
VAVRAGLGPREVDDCTLEELEAWAEAADRQRAADELMRLQSIYASSAAVQCKEGASVFRRWSDKLTGIANGNASQNLY